MLRAAPRLALLWSSSALSPPPLCFASVLRALRAAREFAVAAATVVTFENPRRLALRPRVGRGNRCVPSERWDGGG